jgi:hypothetical protein
MLNRRKWMKEIWCQTVPRNGNYSVLRLILVTNNIVSCWGGGGGGTRKPQRPGIQYSQAVGKRLNNSMVPNKADSHQYLSYESPGCRGGGGRGSYKVLPSYCTHAQQPQFQLGSNQTCNQPHLSPCIINCMNASYTGSKKRKLRIWC